MQPQFTVRHSAAPHPGGHPLFELPQRSDLHMARKMWHMGGVFMMFMLYHTLPFWVSMGILLTAWMAFVPADLMRQKNAKLNVLLVSWFKPIMRKCELDRISGTSYLLSGVLIIDCLFPKEIVSISLLFLAFADPIASFFGIKFGKHKIFGQKSAEGFLAGFVVCVVCTFLYFYTMGYATNRIFIFSLLAGVVGAISELLSIWDLDDNFTLPILSSVGVSLLMMLLPLGLPA